MTPIGTVGLPALTTVKAGVGRLTSKMDSRFRGNDGYPAALTHSNYLPKTPLSVLISHAAFAGMTDFAPRLLLATANLIAHSPRSSCTTLSHS